MKKYIISCPNSIVCSKFLYFWLFWHIHAFYIHHTKHNLLFTFHCFAWNWKQFVPVGNQTQSALQQECGQPKNSSVESNFVQHPLFAEHYLTVIYSICSLLGIWSREQGAPWKWIFFSDCQFILINLIRAAPVSAS